ncbi:MAG: PEGA domain-containing protein [Planctomycetes bacterium]|nr:PEGA domain-containing protein [Planctomycetota bacterium]
MLFPVFLIQEANNMKKSKITIFASLIALTIAMTGCVERKLTINTNPPGGLVTLNDEEIGVAPVTVPFSWYGDYNVRITKEGYATLKTHKLLKAPLHDGFPFDFFAECLWPGRIIDEYEWTFDLTPYQAPDRDKLIQKAEETRKRAKDLHEEATRKS